MKSNIIQWAENHLKNYLLKNPAEILLETPWSKVIRFSTSKGKIYLKQPVPDFSQEANILKLLAEQFHAKVPQVIASDDKLHCFLMKDAGQTLRSYLKTTFQLDWLKLSIDKFTAMQRSIENNLGPFFDLKVPDRRLDKLLHLYDHIVEQKAFLKANGLTEKEVKLLQGLRPKIAEELNALAEYQIPETIVQPDFNTNNILINPETKELTFIDLGELAIAHPFFSLHNFLYQATIHHSIHSSDYQILQDTCIENWQEFGTPLKAFHLSKTLWPIYSAITYYHFMHCVDREALKRFYPNRPNKLAEAFRAYIK